MASFLEKVSLSTNQPLKEEYGLLDFFYIKNNFLGSLFISTFVYLFFIPLFLGVKVSQNINLSIWWAVIFAILFYFRRCEKFFFYIFSFFMFVLSIIYFYDLNLSLALREGVLVSTFLSVSIVRDQILFNLLFFILSIGFVAGIMEGDNFGFFKFLFLSFVSTSYFLTVLLKNLIYGLLWFPLVVITFFIFKYNRRMYMKMELNFKQVPFLPTAKIFASYEEIELVNEQRYRVFQKLRGGKKLGLFLFLIEHVLWGLFSPFILSVIVIFVSFKEGEEESLKERILNIIKSKEVLRGVVFAEDVASHLKISYSKALSILNKLELEGQIQKYWGKYIIYVDPRICDERVLKKLVRQFNLAPSRKITPVERTILKMLWIGGGRIDLSFLGEIIKEREKWDLSLDKLEYVLRLLFQKGLVTSGYRKIGREKISLDQVLAGLMETVPVETSSEILEEKIERIVRDGLNSAIIREKAFEYAIDALEEIGLKTSLVEPKFHLIYRKNLPLEERQRKYLCRIAFKVVKFIYMKVKSLPYIPGPPTDYISEMETTINVGGDCIEKSILIATLLMILGFKTTIKILKTSTMHAVATTYIPYYGEIWLDPDKTAKIGEKPKNAKTVIQVNIS